MFPHPNAAHHECDVVEVRQEERPDGGSVPHVLNDGLHGLACHPVHQLAGVLHLPGDVTDVLGGISAPNALAIVLGLLLSFLEQE